jgi:hypothetical protein
MATQPRSEYDQRPESQQQPPREVPDFPALAKQFPNWSPGDLEILWSRHDQIQSVADFKFFLFYCRKNELDPVGEAIPLYRYDPIKRRDAITPIVSIGVMRKRRAAECDGLDQFKFDHQGEALISASGTIYRKNCGHPFSATVYYDEYAATDRKGNLSPIWVGKGHMLLSKCLEAMLTRLAFFDLIGELMIDEETQKQAVEESPTQTAATEQFKVGEKPEPVAETKPAPAETKPVSSEPAPAPAETKAPVIEMPKPAAAAAPLYTIKVVAEGDGTQILQEVKGEFPQPNKEAAGLRARALSTQFSCSFVVCDEHDEVVIVCNPLSESHGKAPSAAAPQPDAPPPAEPAATPEPAAPMTFDVMIAKATAAIGGTSKDAAKIITRYIAAYLDLSVKALPKDREKLTPPLNALMAVLDEKVGALKADPEGLGTTIAGRTVSALDREFAMLRWPPAIRDMARKVMALLGHDEPKFIAWLGMPIAGDLAISSLEPAALEILFPLYLLVKARAFEVIDFAIASNEGVTKTLQEMVECSGLPMAKWDEPFATRILDAIKKLGQKNAVAPPPPPTDDWSTGGLPFED